MSKKVKEIEEKANIEVLWLIDNPSKKLSYSVIEGSEKLMRIGIVIMNLYKKGKIPKITKIENFMVIEITIN